MWREREHRFGRWVVLAAMVGAGLIPSGAGADDDDPPEMLSDPPPTATFAATSATAGAACTGEVFSRYDLHGIDPVATFSSLLVCDFPMISSFTNTITIYGDGFAQTANTCNSTVDPFAFLCEATIGIQGFTHVAGIGTAVIGVRTPHEWTAALGSCDEPKYVEPFNAFLLWGERFLTCSFGHSIAAGKPI